MSSSEFRVPSSEGAYRNLEPGTRNSGPLAGLGEIELPALSMDIFDPVQKQYRTLRSEGMRLQVSAAGFAPWTRAAENIAGASYLLELVLRRPVALARLKPTRNGNASRKRVVSAATR